MLGQSSGRGLWALWSFGPLGQRYSSDLNLVPGHKSRQSWLGTAASQGRVGTPWAHAGRLSLCRWARSRQDFPRTRPVHNRLEPEARCPRPREAPSADCCETRCQRGWYLGTTPSQNRGPMEAQRGAGFTPCQDSLPHPKGLPGGAVAIGPRS